jgi:hypothetical protein
LGYSKKLFHTGDLNVYLAIKHLLHVSTLLCEQENCF